MNRTYTFAALLVAFVCSQVVAARVASAAGLDTPTVTLESCGGGISAVSITPIKNFDPAAADDQSLETNGYPFRPAGGPELVAWKKYVSTFRSLTTHCSDRTAKTGVSHHPTNFTSLSTAFQPSTSGSVSHNWTGNVATGGFTDAEGSWTLPAAVVGDNGGGGNSTTWAGVGIGRSPSFPLVQAGTQSDYPSRGSSGSPIYTIWWEVYPELSEQDQTQGVHPGDSISIHVQMHTNYAGMHVVDLTQNYNKLFQYTGSFSPDGNAEWIYERGPDNCAFGSCTYPPLAKAPARFTYAAASTDGSHFTPVGSTTHNYFLMYSCTGNLELAYPGAISNDGTAFSPVFVHTGSTDPEPC